VTGIVAELVVEPDVPVTVTVYPPSPVVEVVVMVSVGPGPPSTGVPAVTACVPELKDIVGAVVVGEMVAARLTVPVKPLRPLTLIGRVVDAGRPSAAALPLVTVKVGVAVPGHVTSLVAA
jgi:hypothetical protein